MTLPSALTRPRRNGCSRTPDQLFGYAVIARADLPGIGAARSDHLQPVLVGEELGPLEIKLLVDVDRLQRAHLDVTDGIDEERLLREEGLPVQDVNGAVQSAEMLHVLAPNEALVRLLDVPDQGIGLHEDILRLPLERTHGDGGPEASFRVLGQGPTDVAGGPKWGRWLEQHHRADRQTGEPFELLHRVRNHLERARGVVGQLRRTRKGDLRSVTKRLGSNLLVLRRDDDMVDQLTLAGGANGAPDKRDAAYLTEILASNPLGATTRRDNRKNRQ